MEGKVPYAGQPALCVGIQSRCRESASLPRGSSILIQLVDSSSVEKWLMAAQLLSTPAPIPATLTAVPALGVSYDVWRLQQEPQKERYWVHGRALADRESWGGQGRMKLISSHDISLDLRARNKTTLNKTSKSYLNVLPSKTDQGCGHWLSDFLVKGQETLGEKKIFFFFIEFLFLESMLILSPPTGHLCCWQTMVITQKQILLATGIGICDYFTHM